MALWLYKKKTIARVNSVIETTPRIVLLLVHSIKASKASRAFILVQRILLQRSNPSCDLYYLRDLVQGLQTISAFVV